MSQSHLTQLVSYDKESGTGPRLSQSHQTDLVSSDIRAASDWPGEKEDPLDVAIPPDGSGSSESTSASRPPKPPRVASQSHLTDLVSSDIDQIFDLEGIDLTSQSHLTDLVFFDAQKRYLEALCALAQSQSHLTALVFFDLEAADLVSSDDNLEVDDSISVEEMSQPHLMVCPPPAGIEIVDEVLGMTLQSHLTDLVSSDVRPSDALRMASW